MPGPYTAALALLRDLDALDQELLALQAELVTTPVGLAERRSDIAGASLARDAIAEKLAEHQSRQRDHERDLEAIETRQTRASKRLEALFVAEQISATEREIGQLGEQKDQEELAILELMEETDELSGQLDSANRAISEAESSVAADQTVWDARLPVVQGRITELEAAVGALTPSIPHEAMKAYRIGYDNRNNRRHQGVTLTDGVMCVLCRTEIPARWVNESRNGDGIHRCLGCKRVLGGADPKTLSHDEEAVEA